MIESINNLACENNGVVRTAMKNRGMFDIRDNLIIRLIRTSNAVLSADPGFMADFIFNFDFESIADHKAFKEANNGILYLLNMYHQCASNPPLQVDSYFCLQ